MLGRQHFEGAACIQLCWMRWSPLFTSGINTWDTCAKSKAAEQLKSRIL
jgi:hypothetical protein